MSRIIERALSIINDNLKDQTTSFADPISIKPMARGGRLLEDDYPTHYLPHVGRQVMADGGAPVKGFEGRVTAPVQDESSANPEQDQIRQAAENRAKRVAGNAWDIMSDEQRQQFMDYPDPALGGTSISEADPQELLRQERAISMGHHGPWYHGSERIDRVVEKNKIDPKRATSGPMPFFTDAPDLASSYAEGKKDTSLSRSDTGDVSQYFTVKAKDLGWRSKSDIPVERAWNFLTPDVQKEIRSKATRVGYEDPEEMSGDLKLHPEGVNGSIAGEDHYNYILKKEAQDNPLKALRILWHDSGQLFNEEHKLEDVFKLAGFPHEISQKNAPWAEAKGVLPAMLRIENPLITHNIDELNKKVIPHLEQIFAKDRTRKKQFGADMWDKNTRYTPKEWVSQLKEDLAKGDNSYVWTSIPDKITDQLKVLGYDGIIDTGGKGGGQEHRVAIPFYPHQVRSVFAKFNPEDKMSHDITKAEGGEVDDHDEDISAYHGSPHEFEEFDPAFIGTGEGAQAYGHGLYFAENEDVAKQYRDSLGQPTPIVGGKDLFNISPSAAYTLIAHNGDIESAIEHHRTSEYGTPKIAETLESLRGQPVELRKGGHMYEVRIDAHPEKHLMDYDKLLTEQPANVRKAIKSVIDKKYGEGTFEEYLKHGNDFREVYRNFDDIHPKEYSDALSENGIRGIRYLDAGSRGQDGHTGSHNIVVFDPQHIKIKRKYAKGGEIPHSDDEGIVAYAFGNSIPHLDKIHDEIPEALPQKSYGGAIIPGPKLTEENADDFARRLIAWTFATAPLFHKASGGSVIEKAIGGGSFQGKKPPSIKNLARVKDKFIYHSGTVHDLQSMKDYLEPQHGDWIREIAEHSGYDNPDELLEKSTPLIWMSDKPTWVVSKVARKLNKSHDKVTVNDIREHGHVAVIPRKGDHADHVWRVGEEGLQNGPYSEVTNLNGEKTKAYNTDLFDEDKEPFGVERNEYISAQSVEPLVHLTGNDLVSFLRETGDLPKDHLNKDQTFAGGGSVIDAALDVISKLRR